MLVKPLILGCSAVGLTGGLNVDLGVIAGTAVGCGVIIGGLLTPIPEGN